jgi:hypothetical protein
LRRRVYSTSRDWSLMAGSTMTPGYIFIDKWVNEYTVSLLFCSSFISFLIIHVIVSFF